jgi:hypothetical protein
MLERDGCEVTITFTSPTHGGVFRCIRIDRYATEIAILDALRRDTRRELKRWRGETTP